MGVSQWLILQLYTGNFIQWPLIVYTGVCFWLLPKYVVDLALNKQIVTLLSQLGVSDSSFFGLMNDEIKPLLFSLIEPSSACKTLMNRYPRFRQIKIDCYPQDLTESNVVRGVIFAELKDKLGMMVVRDWRKSVYQQVNLSHLVSNYYYYYYYYLFSSTQLWQNMNKHKYRHKNTTQLFTTAL